MNFLCNVHYGSLNKMNIFIWLVLFGIISSMWQARQWRSRTEKPFTRIVLYQMEIKSDLHVFYFVLFSKRLSVYSLTLKLNTGRHTRARWERPLWHHKVSSYGTRMAGKTHRGATTQSSLCFAGMDLRLVTRVPPPALKLRGPFKI